MSSDLAPVLIGIAAAGLLMVLIGFVSANWRLIERMRMRLAQRPKRGPARWAARQEQVEGPRARSDERAQPRGAAAKGDAGVGEPNVHPWGSSGAIEMGEERAQELLVATERQEGRRRDNEANAERIVEDAKRQARELLEEAELEANRIVVAARQEWKRYQRAREQDHAALERRTTLDSVSTIQEAAHKAAELMADAELRCANLVRLAEAEAQRKATEIARDAKRRARERLDEAEIEAKRIVMETGRERARLLSELEHERSLLEETRTKLGSLAAIDEAVQEAEELLVAAQLRREDLRRKSEAEAERITEEARRHAKELVEEAELEAARVVADAGQERARLADELAQERSVLEETRTRLSGFLADMLGEVEVAPTASEGLARVRDLDEARAARTSTGSNH